MRIFYYQTQYQLIIFKQLVHIKVVIFLKTTNKLNKSLFQIIFFNDSLISVKLIKKSYI